MGKRTLVLGAGPKPERFSNKAVRLLTRYGHPVIAVGLREEQINDIPIQKDFPEEIYHTLTLYINAQRQEAFYEKVENQLPKRVIFNPGTENPEWAERLAKQGVEVVERCTLVMLNSGEF